MCGWLERARTRQERGAAAVEFALVSIVMLTLLTGIIQASIYFWAYQTGAHAAREGAREAAVNPCGVAQITGRVTSRLGSAAADPPSIPTPFPKVKGPGNTVAGEWEAGDQITVSVTFKPPSLSGLIPAFPDITKTATSRVEDVQDC